MKGLLRVVVMGIGLVFYACSLTNHAPPTVQTYKQPDPNIVGTGPYVVLVEMKTTPRWLFWDKPSKGFLIYIGGKWSFVPLGADSGDMISEISGPLSGISDHLMLAAP